MVDTAAIMGNERQEAQGYWGWMMGGIRAGVTAVVQRVPERVRDFAWLCSMSATTLAGQSYTRLLLLLHGHLTTSSIAHMHEQAQLAVDQSRKADKDHNGLYVTKLQLPYYVSVLLGALAAYYLGERQLSTRILASIVVGLSTQVVAPTITFAVETNPGSLSSFTLLPYRSQFNLVGWLLSQNGFKHGFLHQPTLPRGSNHFNSKKDFKGAIGTSLPSIKKKTLSLLAEMQQEDWSTTPVYELSRKLVSMLFAEELLMLDRKHLFEEINVDRRTNWQWFRGVAAEEKDTVYEYMCEVLDELDQHWQNPPLDPVTVFRIRDKLNVISQHMHEKHSVTEGSIPDEYEKLFGEPFNFPMIMFVTSNVVGALALAITEFGNVEVTEQNIKELVSAVLWRASLNGMQFRVLTPGDQVEYKGQDLRGPGVVLFPLGKLTRAMLDANEMYKEGQSKIRDPLLFMKGSRACPGGRIAIEVLTAFFTWRLENKIKFTPNSKEFSDHLADMATCHATAQREAERQAVRGIWESVGAQDELQPLAAMPGFSSRMA